MNAAFTVTVKRAGQSSIGTKLPKVLTKFWIYPNLMIASDKTPPTQTTTTRDFKKTQFHGIRARFCRSKNLHPHSTRVKNYNQKCNWK